MQELEEAFPFEMKRANDENYMNFVQEQRLVVFLLKSEIANILEVEENSQISENQRRTQFKRDLLQKYK